MSDEKTQKTANTPTAEAVVTADKLNLGGQEFKKDDKVKGTPKQIEVWKKHGFVK